MLRHITRATASRNAGTLYTQQATGRGKGSRWQSSPLQIYDRWMNIRSRAPLDSAPNDGERGPTPRDKSRLRAHVSRASNELTRLLKLGDPRLTPLKISAATISQIVSGFDDKSGRTRYSLCDLSAAVQVVLDTRWKTARSIGLQASSELVHHFLRGPFPELGADLLLHRSLTGIDYDVQLLLNAQRFLYAKWNDIAIGVVKDGSPIDSPFPTAVRRSTAAGSEAPSSRSQSLSDRMIQLAALAPVVNDGFDDFELLALILSAQIHFEAITHPQSQDSSDAARLARSDQLQEADTVLDCICTSLDQHLYVSEAVRTVKAKSPEAVPALLQDCLHYHIFRLKSSSDNAPPPSPRSGPEPTRTIYTFLETYHAARSREIIDEAEKAIYAK